MNKYNKYVETDTKMWIKTKNILLCSENKSDIDHLLYGRSKYQIYQYKYL